MKTITFNCEVITPMFLAGADQSIAELRAPSIKGAMRFWWRAMNGHLGLKELKEKETEIFGGGGDNARKSSFSIRVKERSSFQNKRLNDLIKDDNGRIKEEFRGIGYLFYSTFMQKNKQRNYIDNLSFDIIFSFSLHDDKKIQKVLASFWLFSIFGGLGSRARRGGGNIYIKNVESEMESALEFIPHGDDMTSIQDFIQKNFEIIKNLREKDSINIINNNKTYANFNNKANKLLIFDKKNTAIKALNFLGTHYQKFRSRYQPDYDTIKNFIKNSNLKLERKIDKVAFGLPIAYRYRSLNKKSATIEGSNKDRTRSASPIFFRVIKTSNNVFFPIILYIEKDILPQEDKIKIRTSTGKKGLFFPSKPTVINSFFEKLSNEKHVEVQL